MPRPVEDRSDVGGAAQFNNIGPVPLSASREELEAGALLALDSSYGTASVLSFHGNISLSRGDDIEHRLEGLEAEKLAGILFRSRPCFAPSRWCVSQPLLRDARTGLVSENLARILLKSDDEKLRRIRGNRRVSHRTSRSVRLPQSIGNDGAYEYTNFNILLDVNLKAITMEAMSCGEKVTRSARDVRIKRLSRARYRMVESD
jgi:hypothetical protein